MSRKTSYIPVFYLYGEAPQDVNSHFLHLEEIADRSAPVHGQIRAHRHADLNHIFVISQGSGRVLTEGEDLTFTGAHVLYVPAGLVHGFSFSEDIRGHVLTIASAYLGELLRTHSELALPVDLQALPITDRRSSRQLRLWIGRLARELFWQAPSHLAATEACLLGLMVDLHRLRLQTQANAATATGPQHRLLARFRELVEAHFTEALDLDAYLSQLRVSEPQLRYACQKLGQKSPMQLILDRRLIEAKRLLLYSDLSVTQCGEMAGFDDPAYFSRLFKQHTGTPPRQFRTARRQAVA